MNEEETKELLEVIYGIDSVPKHIYGIIASFRKRKSSLRPQPLTVSDVAMLTVVYDFMRNMTEEAVEENDESPEAIAAAEAARELENGE